MLCDEDGFPLDFIITAGQESDYNFAIPLLEKYSDCNVIADRGYDSDEIVQHVENRGKTSVIPSRKNRLKQRNIDLIAYKMRNKIERLFGHLKQLRRVATRFEKLVENYASVIYIACSLRWLNQM
jgi:transposase